MSIENQGDVPRKPKQYTVADSLANIEKIRQEMDEDILKLLNKEGEPLDPNMDPKLKKTLQGLKRAREEAKHPTKTEKFLQKLREITDKKPY